MMSLSTSYNFAAGECYKLRPPFNTISRTLLNHICIDHTSYISSSVSVRNIGYRERKCRQPPYYVSVIVCHVRASSGLYILTDT